MRVGIGYDIHGYQEGRPLILGGVELTGEVGLGGHSDADVLLHAVIDAVLGAAGLGDIGQHFPPSDPAYKDADSRQLLAKAVEMAEAAGYRLESVDATIIVERPRLAPHLGEMRQRMARAMGTDTRRVNVKATSSEGIGALGRGEGIAALAVALLAEGQ